MKLTKTRLKNLILEALEEVEQGLSEISVDYLSRSSDTELEADLQYAKDSCVGLAKSHPKYDEWEEWLSQQEPDSRGRPACKTKKELDREKAQKEKQKTADVPKWDQEKVKPEEKPKGHLKDLSRGDVQFALNQLGLNPEQILAIAKKKMQALPGEEERTVIAAVAQEIDDFFKRLAVAGRSTISEYHYAVKQDDPLSIKEIAANWALGQKPYDEETYHGMYTVDELLEYRNFEWAEEADQQNPEEWNKLLQDVKESGIIEPVVIHVGKNGQAAIAEGNHRLAVAQQVNIRDIPVKFVFLEDEVRKASKMTQEPAEIQVPDEEVHSDKYYIR